MVIMVLLFHQKCLYLVPPLNQARVSNTILCKNERPKNFRIVYLIVNKILRIVIADYGK